MEVRQPVQDLFALKRIIFYQRDAQIALKWSLLYMVAILAFLSLPLPTGGPIEFFRQNMFRIAQAALVVSLSWRAFNRMRRAYWGFQLTYSGFHYRILQYQIDWKAPLLKNPNLWYILTKDLEEYENQYRSYVRHYRRNLDIFYRDARWQDIGDKLLRQLEELLERFAISADERSVIMERWQANPNPNTRKKFLSSLQSRLYHQEFLARPAPPIILPDSGNEAILATSEDESELPEGTFFTRNKQEKLLRAAEAAAGEREKHRLIRQAVWAGRKAYATAVIATDQKDKQYAEVSFLSLQDLARERFSLSGIVPPRLDHVMAREIILALLSPGQRGRRFQAAYRAEDTLRVMVRKQYEVHLRRQFSPRVFRDTLSWLVKESILVTKPKTDEQVFSLSSKTRGKSDQAQRIIAAFINFDRSLRIM